MADDQATAVGQLDLIRAAVPVFALAVAGLAIVSEPAGWWQAAVLVAAVGLFAGWARWGLPTPLLTVGVLVAVVVVQLEPHLEPATFLLCLLGIVITRWEAVGLGSGLSVAAMVATPAVITIQRGDEYGWPIWMIATVFTASIGWLLRRQHALATQLDQTRLELAKAALQEERQRIARDVHDLVGHGLAAIMVQVASARHVLARNPDAADEALATAEDVGRQSLQELRRTVALLRRSDEDSGLDAPLPGLTQLGDVVDGARQQGLDVEYRVDGSHAEVDPAVGLAVHRIAQEALTNAARHAPHARTVVTTTVDNDAVTLTVDSIGAVVPDVEGRDRPRFGLQGMRERADMVGGTFSAGPTSNGWSVRCRVPWEVSR